MNGLDLSTRLDPWAMAFLITLALMTPVSASSAWRTRFDPSAN